MTQTTDGGTLGNLTPEQEVKLQRAWIHILRLCGNKLGGLTDSHPDKSPQFLQHLNDKTKTPAEFQQSLWRFIVNDHPDATVLRFLRARKWDVEAAMEMLVSAVNWREETNIDEKIIHVGESVGLKTPPSKTENEFLDQWRSGKSYARCTDREKRPIYVVRVKLHDPSKQGPEAMETYILHSIESLRLLARAPNDRACLIFDLTGFGLKNMDYHVVKFLIQVFESRYPETLGAVLVHNAPFVFWGMFTVQDIPKLSSLIRMLTYTARDLECRQALAGPCRCCQNQLYQKHIRSDQIRTRRELTEALWRHRHLGIQIRRARRGRERASCVCREEGSSPSRKGPACPSV